MGSDLGGSAPRNTVRRLWATGILILAAGVLAGSGHGGEVPPVASGLVRAAVWFSLMVLPGLGVYLVLERDPNLLDLCEEHVDRMTPPVGWTVRDERVSAAALTS